MGSNNEMSATTPEYRIDYKSVNHLLSNLHEDMYTADWMQPEEDVKVFVPFRDYILSQTNKFITGGLYKQRRYATFTSARRYMETYLGEKSSTLVNKNVGGFKTVFLWYIRDLAHIMLKITVGPTEQHYRELTPTLPSVMWKDQTRYELNFDWEEEHLEGKLNHLLTADTVDKFRRKCDSGEIDLENFIKRIFDNLELDFKNIIDPLEIFRALSEGSEVQSRLVAKALVYQYTSALDLMSVVDEYKKGESMNG